MKKLQKLSWCANSSYTECMLKALIEHYENENKIGE